MEKLFSEIKDYIVDHLKVSNVFMLEQHQEHSLILPSDVLLEVMGYLKHVMKFTQLTDITAVDYPDRPKRFEVVYHVLNMQRNIRLRLKVKLADEESVASIHRVYRAANWYEREVFDMFGIQFDQHPNLSRILNDYIFESFPLRKDFPTEGRLETYYDEASHSIICDAINLPQARRQFDFMRNKWHTPTYEELQQSSGKDKNE